MNVALDLGRAISCARLGDYGEVVLYEVLEDCWPAAAKMGLDDLIPVRPNLRRLTREIGVPNAGLMRPPSPSCSPGSSPAATTDRSC